MDSIVGQTYDNLEIILLNDGSTDNSLSIMQRYAANDNRIKIIDKQNQGYGATCNRGLTEATGTWISIVEPDDWIEPGMYSDMLAFEEGFAQAGTPLDIVKTPYWRIWMPDTKQQRKLNCSYKNRIHPGRQPFAIADAAHLLCHHPSIWSSIANHFWTIVAFALKRFLVLVGPTIRSWLKRCVKPTVSVTSTPHIIAIAETPGKIEEFCPHEHPAAT